jgi:putative acetyltransferase
VTDDLAGVAIRKERPGDWQAVNDLITRAFRPMPFSSGTEAAIATSLRQSGAAVVALVAELAGDVVGQVIFSPAFIGGRPSPWHALGPVAVAPALQRSGIGSRLIREGLERLKAMESEGCIVLGAPPYYQRFGFQLAPSLAPPGIPAAYFMVLSFSGTPPTEVLAYHHAFEADVG